MKYLYLAKSYDLVVGDTFEMFYRGIICLNNPYKYYIFVRCKKGIPYPRYFTYTPKEDEVGDYDFSISLIDDENNVIEEAKTILHVVKPIKPKQKLNVLCIGDSITSNGVWPKEGYRRFTKNGGIPEGIGFRNSINMLGSCKVDLDGEEIGYEGYGCWMWKSYCTNDIVSMNSAIWVNVDSHNLDENDQHSKWLNGNLYWVLETIEKNRLKFKRDVNNHDLAPVINSTFINTFGGIHKENINITSYEFEQGNPFWNKEIQDIDFKNYVKQRGYEKIDLVYFLLSWNGMYKPFNKDFSHHIDSAKKLFRKIHSDYKDAKICVLGIQICSVNGGMQANYGAYGYYSETLGVINSAFSYNEALEQLVNENEFKDYCRYVDTKAMFDSEYNYPSQEKSVNIRSSIKERLGTNGVHPNMDGYLQLGDVFYRALVKDVINNNNH